MGNKAADKRSARREPSDEPLPERPRRDDQGNERAWEAAQPRRKPRSYSVYEAMLFVLVPMLVVVGIMIVVKWVRWIMG